MTQAAEGLRLLAPRTSLSSSLGVGLSNVIVDELPDGALCVVPGQGLYQLDKSSSATVASPEVVATGKGSGVAGRWVRIQSSTGSSEPLSTTMFVDGDTATPTSLQDGSIERPFATIQAALNAIDAADAALNRWYIYLSPNLYTGNLIIPENRIIAIDGHYGEATDIDGTITWNVGDTSTGGGWLQLSNVSHVEDFTIVSGGAAAILVIRDCEMGAIAYDANSLPEGVEVIIGCTTPNYTNGTLNQTAPTGKLVSIDLALASTSTVYLSNVQVESHVSAGTLYAQTTQFLGIGAIITLSETVCEMRSCKFASGSVTVEFTGAAGEFRIDGTTNFFWKAAIETLTNGSKVIVDDTTA